MYFDIVYKGNDLFDIT